MGKMTIMQASRVQPLSVPATDVMLGARKHLFHPSGATVRLCAATPRAMTSRVQTLSVPGIEVKMSHMRAPGSSFVCAR